MKKIRYDHKQRSSLILDAGYVSIKTNDQLRSSIIIGLHGKKLVCVILIVLSLFLISCINLTCLIWILLKLDWSPFSKNGSEVFRYDYINDQVDLYHQGMFEKAIYTTKITDSLQMDLLSTKQIDIYGDHNSIFFDYNQIAMNTEYFHMNNKTLVDFTQLHLLKFDPHQRTRIHLDRINTKHIHHQSLNLFTEQNLTISNANQIFFSSQNLSLITNRNHRQSIIRFNNPPRRKHSFDHRRKASYGNLDFQVNSIFLDIPQLPLEENRYRDDPSIYRLCICNTTFLLLRSFAHQPCPLC